ncbi:cell division protein SepF [Streptomyces sp. CHA1]|jgi:cell division inhibitor SepF|uniref:Cell division protein SepF n=3 Tax=Streptomyces TaxID=1883 RepID=A0A385DHD2_9ACTN|nr:MULTISPECIES: cell division protein SepF [Streptomyces]KIX79498.1 cell division protein SepF [Streptomyces sp. MBRL 601]MBZ2409895.1 cell division protein SepF [Streptomyces sp. L06]MYQ73684.1 cell division protein SepF [Streptomyces sp. SID4934]MYW58789.1 cell division protein SepF [Streptomyces sp. SID8370]MYW86882.1 cell division protein SepF [Streptomyces sp. SID8371]MYX50729.1 cell division protein SepF [Streptomyces sp. SID8385]MYX84465.1 cell division protein SepF [Streptomyces sp.
MAGAMRKMAVYLGLVEDDGYDGPGFDPDDEFEPEPEPERDRRRHAPAHQEQAEEPVRAPQPPAQREREPVPLPAESGRPARIAPVASITPERQSLEKNAPVIMPKVVSEREPYRITTLHPRTYNEARTIGEHFREGTPVIMNLTEMDDTDAKRLVDFAAGLVFGLHGSIERVTQKVFLLSPANVDVTAEDKARIAEGGFFNQS